MRLSHAVGGLAATLRLHARCYWHCHKNIFISRPSPTESHDSLFVGYRRAKWRAGNTSAACRAVILRHTSLFRMICLLRERFRFDACAACDMQVGGLAAGVWGGVVPTRGPTVPGRHPPPPSHPAGPPRLQGDLRGGHHSGGCPRSVSLTQPATGHWATERGELGACMG